MGAGVSRPFGVPVLVCPLWCGVGTAGGFVGRGPSFLPARGPLAVPLSGLVAVSVGVVSWCPRLMLVWVLAVLLLLAGAGCSSVYVLGPRRP